MLLYRIVMVIFCYLQCGLTWNIKMPVINSLNPYCYFQECCNAGWIKFNQGRLMRSLTDHVYGQPFLATAVQALSFHFNPDSPPKKALTLSFHGMTGTGKNYVSKFIAESMFLEGTKSKYVHQFIGRMHFSEESKLAEYKLYLYSLIKENMSKCTKQLFIFDEVDKMIPEVLDVLKPLIDYHDEIQGVSYSQAVFIFISNTGSDVINKHYYDLCIDEGRNREDLTISDFETLIQRGAFNEKGLFNRENGYFSTMARKILYMTFLGSMYQYSCNFGEFHHCDTMKSNLIDHYIPFLPLEKQHVIRCIQNEFKLRKVLNPKIQHIEQAIKFIGWSLDYSQRFAKAGCKSIGSKVAVLAEKYYFDNKDEL